MDTGYITSISINELMVWYSSGELRLPNGRILPMGLNKNGTPEADEVIRQQVMDLLPHVDLEDEHSILVITMSKNAMCMAEGSWLDRESNQIMMDVSYMPISAIRSISPLTARGGDIVKSRLQGLDLKLSEPLFEEDAQKLWHQWSIRRSVYGADALLNMVVKNAEFAVSKDFFRNAMVGLGLINSQQEKVPNKMAFLVHVLCYTRHSPIPSDDIGFFADLGILLKEKSKIQTEYAPVVKELRQFYENYRKNKKNLPELISLPEVREVLNLMAMNTGADIDLYSALLFLKWKHQTQRAQRIEMDDLIFDVKKCADKVNRISIEKAIWLLGFYWGFDHMAHDCYVRDPDQYEFIAEHVQHKPIDLFQTIPSDKSVQKSMHRKRLAILSKKEPREVSHEKNKKKRWLSSNFNSMQINRIGKMRVRKKSVDNNGFFVDFCG